MNRKLPKDLARRLERHVSPEAIPRWLQIPNPMLGDRTPQSLIDAGEEHLIVQAMDRTDDWRG